MTRFWGFYLFVLSYSQVSLGAGGGRPSEGPDEIRSMIFDRFPYYESREWKLPLEAVLYEHEPSSFGRAATHKALELSLGLVTGRLGASERREFADSSKWFLEEPEAGQRLHFKVGDKEHVSTKSREDGFVHETIKVGRTCPLPKYCERAASAYGIISDIDDTVKESGVLNKTQLIRSTFLKPFAPVASSFAHLRRELKTGASLHFVSASPWQLHERLTAGIGKSLGAYPFEVHLRRLHARDFASAKKFLTEPSFDYKIKTVSEVIRRFPHKTFVLVGDTGERDPEVYAEIQKRHARQVSGIYLRQITGADNRSERFANLRNLVLYQ